MSAHDPQSAPTTITMVSSFGCYSGRAGLRSFTMLSQCCLQGGSCAFLSQSAAAADSRDCFPWRRACTLPVLNNLGSARAQIRRWQVAELSFCKDLF